MTAHPRSQPLPGPMPQMPPAAPPPATVAEPLGPVVSGARKGNVSRNAKAALTLSLLVAVAGVSFSAGRLSVDGGASSTERAFPNQGFPAAAAEAGSTGSTGSTTTTNGSETVEVAALAAAVTETDVESLAASGDADDLPAMGQAGEPPTMGDAGARPGFGGGRSGVVGTVSGIGDGSLTVELADGSTQAVTIDDTTTWLRQQQIEATDVRVGDTVSVQLPFAGPGSDSSEDSTSAAASQVTVTASSGV